MNLINKKIVENIFSVFAFDNPNPTTELIYSNNFELLISVILSAQSTDRQVNKVTEKLFVVANNASDMYKLGLEEIQLYIKSLGLYRSKAKNIYETSKIIMEQYDDDFPKTYQELQLLPGVGRKTANVVLNTAFDELVIAVDTHVQRVSQRLGLTDNNNLLAIEQDLYNIIPKNFLKNAHHWLILHGRYTCKARAPICHDCKIKNFCLSYTKY